MQHIDAFCHFFPQGIFKKLSETAGGTRDIGKRIQGVRTIYDLDARFRIMDAFENYSQVLSAYRNRLGDAGQPHLGRGL